MARRGQNVIKYRGRRGRKNTFRNRDRPYTESRRGHFPRFMRPWLKVIMLLLIAIAVVTYRESRAILRATLSGSVACEVISVVDGDTIIVSCPDRGFERTRLMGFDTPEVFSPQCLSESWAGAKATLALRKRIWSAKEVKLVFRGTDKYGRRLALLLLDGTNVSNLMIEAGHARSYAGGKREGWC